MRVVIDISKHEWEYLNKLVKNGDQLGHYERLLVNGTPLPKGHGRLIDADALEKKMCDREEELGDDKALWESSAVSTALDMFAPTIVPADKQTSGCSSCPHSGSIIDGVHDCTDAYKEQSQYCGLNNKEE